jgi:hypothetical protein
LSKLRTSKQSNFTLNFVVQRANFREMPEFVDLAARLNTDRVLCSHILRWDHAMNEAEYAEISEIWIHTCSNLMTRN